MSETAPLVARERAAARALDQLRAVAADLPDAHPAAPLLAAAVAVAERHRGELRDAVEAEQRQQAAGSPHPDDYWSARWRT